MDALARVGGLFEAISAAKIAGVRNLHPAFTTLLVVYSPLVWMPWALVQKLEEAEKSGASTPAAKQPVTIPVCFEAPFSADLSEISARAGIAVHQAVDLFTSAAYHVAFLGFAPGFPYLLGLPPALATPRLARPRTRVAAGSVGIAGEHTGVYPAATPGGWRIIGRTPLRLFEPKREPMSLLMPGDELRFVAIDERKFEDLSQW